MLETILGPYAVYVTFQTVIAAIVVASTFAFYGYTIFKKALILIGAISFGIVGGLYVAPLIPIEVPLINLNVVVAVVFAAVGAVIFACAYRFSLIIIAGIAGYLITLIVLVPMLALEGVMVIVVAAIVSILLIVLLVFLKTMKLLFIILSSVIALPIAFALLALVLFTESNVIFVAVFAAIGFIIGIFGARKQFITHSGIA